MEIYTDGGVQHNGHAHAYGSWAFACTSGKLPSFYERSGIVEPNATVPVTNNRTELMAVIEAIRWARMEKLWAFSGFTIVTDSQLTMNCGRRTWRRKANLDLWGVFDELVGADRVKWRWVHGHRGDEMNEHVDTMCTNVMREYAAGTLPLPSQPAAQDPTVDLAMRSAWAAPAAQPEDTALQWPTIVDPFAAATLAYLQPRAVE